MSTSFVHLRLHTEYSLVDGIVRVKPLVKAVAERGMPAVAMTDQCNMFAMVKFYTAARGAGIKPIFGSDLWLADDENNNELYRLTLLCKNNEGYLNLSRLISRSYMEGQHRGIPIIQRSWLKGFTYGLIALSGGREGDVGMALLKDKREEAFEQLNEWLRTFGDDYFLELSRTGREGEEAYLHQAVELAGSMGIPVVATNDVRFINKDEFEAHEVRVCIHEGRTLDDPRRHKNNSEQQYLRTPEEMAEVFSDIPEALANSVEIAKRCNVELTLGKNFLPDFPIPEGMTEDEYFRALSREGLEKRLQVIFDPKAPDFSEKRKPYDERLEIELDVIISMGFPGYFLIVADFIRWSKENGIPVGPGRGSGAGSLVAYAMTITDLDPLEYDLLFERFLNPERVSMPDFDIDFCMEGRDRVIDYVARYYGREKVSQIITYGTMAAKAVVRDVGRVQGHPYGFVDQIAKLIPFEIGMTLDKAMEQEEALRERYADDEEFRTLYDMARSLEGITRNAGKHAGGVVIAPSELTDFSPLFCEEGGQGVVTQFDKNDVESVGLVKFDFLGLRTLTIIDWALQNIQKRIEARGGDVAAELPDITLIPLDDKPSFSLLKNCGTTAVFQLESRGMKDLIKRLQPDCFEDIIALVALFRPGPLQSGMVDNFINRKHGREKVSYPDAQYQHESLKPILEPTYGIILYQEQVMQIAQVLAGYTLGGADLLRRAMGKKKPEEMAKQRSFFAEGAEKNGIDSELAMKIFDLVEKFAGYGFNKSHSAAYALVSYQTLWLKAHYPAEFMAAVLSADMDNTDKVVILIEECNSMGLQVNPPDVNFSKYRFTVTEDGRIVYGLGAIKGVGEAAIHGIVHEAQENGPYQDLFDFCRRNDLKKVNRRVLESLIKSGALDQLQANRATLMANLPQAIKIAEQFLASSQMVVNDLFGFDSSENSAGSQSYNMVPEWDEQFRLLAEKETLGLYLTGHPITPYIPELEHITSCRIANVKPARNKKVLLAGLVIGIRTVTTRRGDKMAIITLDDRSARIDATLYSETYQFYRDKLSKDTIVVVQGEVSVDDFNGGYRISVSTIFDIEHAREHFAKRLRLNAVGMGMDKSFQDALDKVISPYSDGTLSVVLDYSNDNAVTTLSLGDEWRVTPSNQLLHKLTHLFGDEERVRIEYQ